MKLYKFRGKGRDGKIHFGSLVQEFTKFGGETVVKCTIIESAGTKREEEFFVENDSVAQLVGYDIYGEELYEGDDLSTIAKYI